MTYVTIYTKAVKHRGSLSPTTYGRMYQTKSLTPHHAALRGMFADAQTWANPKRVITDFVPGLNLGTLPIVLGGERVG